MIPIRIKRIKTSSRQRCLDLIDRLYLAMVLMTSAYLSDAAASAEIVRYQTMFSFGSVTNDGAQPIEALIEGNDGTLFGTTFRGGKSDYGTVFRINKDGSEYRVLHHFRDRPADGAGPWGV